MLGRCWLPLRRGEQGDGTAFERDGTVILARTAAQVSISERNAKAQYGNAKVRKGTIPSAQ